MIHELFCNCLVEVFLVRHQILQLPSILQQGGAAAPWDLWKAIPKWPLVGQDLEFIPRQVITLMLCHDVCSAGFFSLSLSLWKWITAGGGVWHNYHSLSAVHSRFYWDQSQTASLQKPSRKRLELSCTVCKFQVIYWKWNQTNHIPVVYSNFIQQEIWRHLLYQHNQNQAKKRPSEATSWFLLQAVSASSPPSDRPKRFVSSLSLKYILSCASKTIKEPYHYPLEKRLFEMSASSTSNYWFFL